MIFRLLSVAAVTIGLAGCPTYRSAQYPVDWPTIVYTTSCSELDGVFVNRTRSTTYEQVRENPELSSSYLSQILTSGTSGNGIYDGYVVAVRLEAKSMVATFYGTAGQVISTLGLKHWQCTEGTLRASFVEDEQAYFTVGLRAYSSLRLSKAIDGSLIVHSSVVWRDGFPTGGGSENWMMFLPTNIPAAAQRFGQGGGTGLW